MSFSDLVQRAAGYKITATDWNAVVDGVNLANSGTASKGRPAVQASSADTSTISRNAWSLMTFTSTDDFDTASMHDTSTNTSRLVVPSGGSGLYRIWGRVSTETTAVAFTGELMIRLNAAGSSSGGTYIHHNYCAPSASIDSTLKSIAFIEWTVRLAANDYVELFYNPRHSTTDYALFGGTVPHKFGMCWLTA